MSSTRKAFHVELGELSEAVIRLAALASESIERGTAAFLDADLTAAETLLIHDKQLDELTASIEARAFQLLARQQPMAGDLRTLVTIIRVIHELERVGDNMVNVAKATRRMFPHELDAKTRGLIQRMREQAVLQLRIAVQAFAERDPARGAALNDMDDVMDDLQKELFRSVFALPADEDSMMRGVQLALVGRYFERVADHAVNFGERVCFMVTGTMEEDPLSL